MNSIDRDKIKASITDDIHKWNNTNTIPSEGVSYSTYRSIMIFIDRLEEVGYPPFLTKITKGEVWLTINVISSVIRLKFLNDSVTIEDYDFILKLNLKGL